MPRGIPNGETCRSLSSYEDGIYLLHYPKAKLEDGCWNKQIPDKYLKKENGEIIGYEKQGGVYQEMGRARSIVEGRLLWANHAETGSAAFVDSLSTEVKGMLRAMVRNNAKIPEPQKKKTSPYSLPSLKFSIPPLFSS